MIERIVTAVFLTLWAGLTLSLFRLRFELNDIKLTKFMSLYTAGFIVIANLVFAKTYRFASPLSYLAVMAFPGALWLLLRACRRRWPKRDYPMNLILGALLLTGLGILLHYRLNLFIKRGMLATMLGVPVAVFVNHMLFSGIGVLMSGVFLLSGYAEKTISFIEQRTTATSGTPCARRGATPSRSRVREATEPTRPPKKLVGVVS